MKKMISLSLLVFWVPSAFGYIDTGSGSAIMSAVIGFFVAISLAVKTYWYKIKSFFSKPADVAEIEDDDQRT